MHPIAGTAHHILLHDAEDHDIRRSGSAVRRSLILPGPPAITGGEGARALVEVPLSAFPGGVVAYRGGDDRTGELFSYVDLEARVRRDHPLRAIRVAVNEALAALERDFAALYSPIGRPSIPPEKLLRAMLLQAFYSIRSERLLMERLEYDVLFRWFVGIGIDDAAWDHSVFSKNRDRLLEGDIATKFLGAVLV